MNALDLDLASVGYLRSHDGLHVRHIIGLEQLVRDTCAADASVVWVPIAGAGACDCAQRLIALNPWVFWAWPWFIKRVWRHELLHIRYGPGEQRMARLCEWLYPDVCPPEWDWA